MSGGRAFEAVAETDTAIESKTTTDTEADSG
jgi:hypothetical protein